MFVSHACQFVIFPGPLGTSPELSQLMKAMPVHTANTRQPYHRHLPPRAALSKAQGADANILSYPKIAIIENPYTRLVRIYDRIVARDPVWRLRRKAGIAIPQFTAWLNRTQRGGASATGFLHPLWRRHGVWPADKWSGGVIDHFVRADQLNQDLQQIFHQMKVSPILPAAAKSSDADLYAAMQCYDSYTAALVRDRYSFDLRIFQDDPPRPVRVA